MRLVILHYHIFKNAGSTIEDILHHSFGDRFAALDTSFSEGLISNSELVRFCDDRPNLRALSSHQIRHPLPETSGYLFFDICFLRDPFDRIRSIYTYCRQKPNFADPINHLANHSTLGDFVAGMIQDFPLFTKNVQVNLLACGGDSDEPEQGDLDLAIERMLSTRFLGVVDCFDQSIVAGSHALRAAFPELDCDRPAVNVSEGLQSTVASRIEKLRQACSKEVYEELLRLNALDLQLVERARAEVLRRFQKVPRRVARPVKREEPHTPAAAGFFIKARRFISLALYWRQIAGRARQALFDADYYRASSLEGRSLPLLHFLVQGAYQGRKPNPLFDPAYYLRRYPGVAASGVNPLCHYLKHGAAEALQPHPLFDSRFYLDRNPDVQRSGMNPLFHYVRHGAVEDRKPLRLFEPIHYRNGCQKALDRGQNPLIHFLENGARAASPHPLFDCDAYLDAHPDVAARDENPLVDYLLKDAEEPAGPPIVESAAIVHLEIQDVALIAVCVDENLDFKSSDERRAILQGWKSWAARQKMPGSVALVWADADGVAQWLAEPQQQPFLDAVRLDQVRAQRTATTA